MAEVAPEGARQLLAQVLIAEAAFVAQWKDLKLPDGRDRVVGHGHGPQRAIQTGVGPVDIRRAKGRRRGGENLLHLVDPAEVGAADQEPRPAFAVSLSAWGVDRRLPGGAGRTVGKGRAEHLKPASDRSLAARLRSHLFNCLPEPERTVSDGPGIEDVDASGAAARCALG
jgi:hypothetical protein